MTTRKLTEMSDFERCVELMKKDGRGEPTPSDVFRVDAIGSIYEELDKGYVIGIEDGDELVGFSRVTATFEPNIHWIHEFFGEGASELFSAIKEEGQRKGATKFVWLLKDGWLRELSELFDIEENIDPDIETLVHLDLTDSSVEKEEISFKDLKLRVYSEDPLVTNAISYDQLEDCVRIQKAVGWGDISAPVRILKPEMLSEHFSVIMGVLFILKEDNGKTEAFVRLSACFKRGYFYGHEGAMTPALQSSGVGKFALNLVGDFVKTLTKNPKALEVVGRMIKNAGSLSRVRIGATIDPLNAKMLGLATGSTVESIGAYMRGVHIAENLYGVWDTDAHGKANTDRIIVIAGLLDKKKRPEPTQQKIITTEEELEEIDSESFFIELPDINMEMSDIESKNRITRMLAKSINEKGYTLTHVNSRGTPRYLLVKM